MCVSRHVCIMSIVKKEDVTSKARSFLLYWNLQVNQTGTQICMQQTSTTNLKMCIQTWESLPEKQHHNQHCEKIILKCLHRHYQVEWWHCCFSKKVWKTSFFYGFLVKCVFATLFLWCSTDAHNVYSMRSFSVVYKPQMQGSIFVI